MVRSISIKGSDEITIKLSYGEWNTLLALIKIGYVDKDELKERDQRFDPTVMENIHDRIAEYSDMIYHHHE